MRYRLDQLLLDEPWFWVLEQEADGRWLAEVVELPGVLAYGASRDEALARAEALALRVIADRLEHGERATLRLRCAC